MGSFDTVNYSLRPSKNIQRQIIFDDLRTLRTRLPLDNPVYIGFGSIWFVDFVLAHRILGIDDMISMEADDIGFARARFNSPYKTVRVMHGLSTEILPGLYEDEEFNTRPWVIWLDYDRQFDEDLCADTRSVLENAPESTVFLITFDGRASKYGNANDRPARLRELFGDVVPDDITKDECDSEQMQGTLADLAIAFMQSVPAESSRPGGFLPAFKINYKDSAPMVTVGGILPSPAIEEQATALVNETRWRCTPDASIVAPHLTTLEAIALQSELPDPDGLSRSTVQSLGFDLEDEQIRVYENYYREWPSFAQIVP